MIGSVSFLRRWRLGFDLTETSPEKSSVVSVLVMSLVVVLLRFAVCTFIAFIDFSDWRNLGGAERSMEEGTRALSESTSVNEVNSDAARRWRTIVILCPLTVLLFGWMRIALNAGESQLENLHTSQRFSA